MAAQIPRRQKPKSWIAWGCGLGFGLALLLILGVAAFAILKAQSGGGILTARIVSPTAEQQSPLNAAVPITAEAANRAGVSRVEVYADGALILAEESVAKPAPEVRATGDWIPLTTGRHALMARGYGPRNTHVDSEIVYVNVTEPAGTVLSVDALHAAGAPTSSLDALAAYLGTSAHDLAGMSPDLTGLSGSDPVPPGSDIHVPPSPGTPPEAPLPPPPLAGAPPAPTGLTGSADCTQASLNWLASPGGQRYRLYRAGPLPYSTAPPVQVGGDLTSTNYSDPLPGPGSYVYQVTAVRDGVESVLSTPGTISMPESCYMVEPPAARAGNLVLTVSMVQTDVVYRGLYCYLHINGGADERFPGGSDFTFIAPAASDAHYYDMTSLPGRGQFDLSGQPLTSPVTFGGRCVGVTTPTPPDPNPELGSFEVSHSQADWDGAERTADATAPASAGAGVFHIHYCLGPSTQPCTPNIPGGLTAGGITIDIPIPLLWLPAPTNVRRLPSTEGCGPFGSPTGLTCTAAGTICNLGFCTPVYTVFWDWTGNEMFGEGDLTGYTVFRTVRDRPSGALLMSRSWEVYRRTGGSPLMRILSADTDLHCDETVEYRVVAHAGDLSSVASPPLVFTTEPCASAAEVTITFDTLQAGPVEDLNDSCVLICAARDTTLEVDGWFRASGGSMSPREIVTDGVQDVEEGTSGLSGWELRNFTGAGGPISNYPAAQGHNIYKARITDRTQTIMFGVDLQEKDDQWSGLTINQVRTPWCVASKTLEGQTPVAWSTWDQWYTLSGGNSEGDCTVRVHVTGAPAR
jgi:Bacterial Ig domain